MRPAASRSPWLLTRACQGRQQGSPALQRPGGHGLTAGSLTWPPSPRLRSPPLLPPQYGEFRGGFNKDSKDTRFVYYGMRYIVENYLLRQWTMKDVEQADIFYK